jgi:hypothetical protein
MILKGNKSTAPINLKISSSDSPTILNGSSISHTIGKRMSMISARGQHNTNKIHQRISDIKVLMNPFFDTVAKY